MAIAVMNLDANGSAPEVRVVVGNFNLGSYTIAMVPPTLDFSQAQPFFFAQTPAQVAAVHPLPDSWPNQSDWFVVIVGGIGGVGDAPNFSVQSSLSQDGNATGMTTSVMTDASAANFVSSIKIVVQ